MYWTLVFVGTTDKRRYDLAKVLFDFCYKIFGVITLTVLQKKNVMGVRYQDCFIVNTFL